MTKDTIKEVQDYWNVEACGSHFVEEFANTEDFYSKYEAYRYRVEWHIPELVPFDNFGSKDVLEIGCGNGIDGSKFAHAGAYYTGVDLTQTAVDATKELFKLRSLNGKFQVENAEALSFENSSFDLVYSHGVIHHSPAPENIVNQIERILKPDGKIIVMLYHKTSFNYYFRIMTYMRLRVLVKILSRWRHWNKDRETVLVDRSTFIAKNDSRTWNAHYANFLDDGWSYLKASNFVHRCTDGPDCPFAKVYTRKDAGELFSQFNITGMKVAHLPLRNSKIGKWIPFFIERFLARKLGFYLFIYARKQ